MRLQLGKVKSNEQEAYAHDIVVLLSDFMILQFRLV